MHFSQTLSSAKAKTWASQHQAGACERHLLCVYVRRLLTSEYDFNLTAIFVQTWKGSVSPITFEFEETSYATFTFPDGARHRRKTSEEQLVWPRCNENLVGDIEMRTSWHPGVPGSLPVAQEEKRGISPSPWGAVSLAEPSQDSLIITLLSWWTYLIPPYSAALTSRC